MINKAQPPSLKSSNFKSAISDSSKVPLPLPVKAGIPLRSPHSSTTSPMRTDKGWRASSPSSSPSPPPPLSPEVATLAATLDAHVQRIPLVNLFQQVLDVQARSEAGVATLNIKSDCHALVKELLDNVREAQHVAAAEPERPCTRSQPIPDAVRSHLAAQEFERELEATTCILRHDLLASFATRDGSCVSCHAAHHEEHRVTADHLCGWLAIILELTERVLLAYRRR